MDALKMAEDLKKNELRKQFLKSFKADIQKKWVNSGFECTHRCRYHQAPRPLAFHREYHRESSPACSWLLLLECQFEILPKGRHIGLD